MDSAIYLAGSKTSLAYGVEQCLCPDKYDGLSCQDPNRGYYRQRNSSSPYLEDIVGRAIPCKCNDRSEECDKETGVCIVRRYFNISVIPTFIFYSILSRIVVYILVEIIAKNVLKDSMVIPILVNANHALVRKQAEIMLKDVLCGRGKYDASVNPGMPALFAICVQKDISGYQANLKADVNLVTAIQMALFQTNATKKMDNVIAELVLQDESVIVVLWKGIFSRTAAANVSIHDRYIYIYYTY